MPFSGPAGILLTPSFLLQAQQTAFALASLATLHPQVRATLYSQVRAPLHLQVRATLPPQVSALHCVTKKIKFSTRDQVKITI